MFTSILLLPRRHNRIQFEGIPLPWAFVSCCQTNVSLDSVVRSTCLSYSAVWWKNRVYGRCLPLLFILHVIFNSASAFEESAKKGKEIPSLLYTCKQEGTLSLEVKWVFLTLWFSKMTAVSYFCRRNTFAHLTASHLLHASSKVPVVIVLVLKPETDGGTDMALLVWDSFSLTK